MHGKKMSGSMSTSYLLLMSTYDYLIRYHLGKRFRKNYYKIAHS